MCGEWVGERARDEGGAKAPVCKNREGNIIEEADLDLNLKLKPSSREPGRARASAPNIHLGLHRGKGC